jgi:hypothetical protein
MKYICKSCCIPLHMGSSIDRFHSVKHSLHAVITLFSSKTSFAT